MRGARLERLAVDLAANTGEHLKSALREVGGAGSADSAGSAGDNDWAAVFLFVVWHGASLLSSERKYSGY